MIVALFFLVAVVVVSATVRDLPRGLSLYAPVMVERSLGAAVGGVKKVIESLPPCFRERVEQLEAECRASRSRDASGDDLKEGRTPAPGG
ncbi:MAG: hypothetical protein HQL59_11325 [Magnetococcales bacterium]|nr:hypothetical protein [Magnetococcales bacterium]